MQPQIEGIFSSMLNSSKVWVLIIVGPLFCLVPDITIKIFSTWWSRSPIDWQIKQVNDEKHIKAVIQADIAKRLKKEKAEAKARRMEERRKQGIDWEEDPEEEAAAEAAMIEAKTKQASVAPAV